MSPNDVNCEAGLVERLLDDGLSPEQQAALESHLEFCARCRRRLADAAASDKFWTEASVHLQEDALDADPDAAAADSDFGSASEGGEDGLPLRGVTDYFDPTDDPRMLGRFGGYEVVGVVGFGGMGVVLKGFEPALNRHVAIKVLAPHLATSGAARRRFQREARAAAAVIHENVVAIHRVAEASGLPYLVMPYMAGVSLQKRLDEQGPLQLTEILRIAMQVAAGLAAAHAQGLVHRDIKPANILLENGVERVKITDFGLARAVDEARLTQSGVVAGTPEYMSPEQARGESVDARSDLFSLGGVLYAMCTGHAPFRAGNTPALLFRVATESPPPIRAVNPNIPEWLVEIIDRLHAKDPAERFPTAQEVAALLGEHLAHLQSPSSAPRPAALPPRPAAPPPHADLRERRMALSDAVNARDFEACHAFIDPAYVARDADGRVLGDYGQVWRELAAVFDRHPDYQEQGTVDHIDARGDTAVIRTRRVGSYKLLGLFDIGRESRWTETWKRTGGTWRMVEERASPGVVPLVECPDCGKDVSARADHCPHCGRVLRSGYEYRSPITFMGLPLVHIARGRDPATGRTRVARGIVAIGERAHGLVAIGGAAFGGIALGGFALGLLSLGGASVGLLLALGGVAVGGLAVGGWALGLVAIGGGAIGYYAVGGFAAGAHAISGDFQDPAAQQFFRDAFRAVIRFFAE